MGDSSLPPFKPFYDAVIGPIVDLLEPQDDELVFVPDGALCLVIVHCAHPVGLNCSIDWASHCPLCDKSSINLKYHHKNTGALLVGNPCLDNLKLKKREPPLALAQKEVEMISSILNTSPLTGSEATKAEVIKQMSSVGLIHSTAHGNKHSGELLLAPNPGWTSKFPKKKGFHFKNVRCTSGQSPCSSCGHRLLSYRTRSNLEG